MAGLATDLLGPAFLAAGAEVGGGGGLAQHPHMSQSHVGQPQAQSQEVMDWHKSGIVQQPDVSLPQHIHLSAASVAIALWI